LPARRLAGNFHRIPPPVPPVSLDAASEISVHRAIVAVVLGTVPLTAQFEPYLRLEGATAPAYSIPL